MEEVGKGRGMGGRSHAIGLGQRYIHSVVRPYVGFSKTNGTTEDRLELF